MAWSIGRFGDNACCDDGNFILVSFGGFISLMAARAKRATYYMIKPFTHGGIVGRNGLGKYKIFAR